MRTLLLLAAALLARPTVSDACSISIAPAASVFQPASGKAPGRRPWIVLWHVDKPVKVTQVSPACAEKTVCTGKDIDVDRHGNYLRPKAALPDGARLQVSMGSTLLADVTVAKGPAAPLPAWDGIAWSSGQHEKEGLCSPAGPVVRLTPKPTKADLDGAVLLVYLEKPDPKQPLAKLAYMTSLYGKELRIGNSLGSKAWFPSVPKKLWVMLGDGEGNTGPVIELP